MILSDGRNGIEIVGFCPNMEGTNGSQIGSTNLNLAPPLGSSKSLHLQCGNVFQCSFELNLSTSGFASFFILTVILCLVM
jgi:hypothetical protein